MTHSTPHLRVDMPTVEDILAEPTTDETVRQVADLITVTQNTYPADVGYCSLPIFNRHMAEYRQLPFLHYLLDSLTGQMNFYWFYDAQVNELAKLIVEKFGNNMIG